MSVGELLLDVVVEFVLHGFGAVLEWLGGCFRRAGAIFRRGRGRDSPPPGG